MGRAVVTGLLLWSAQTLGPANATFAVNVNVHTENAEVIVVEAAAAAVRTHASTINVDAKSTWLAYICPVLYAVTPWFM